MNSASRTKKPAAIFPLMATGLGLTFMCLLGYKFYVGPYLMTQRRERNQILAESWWDLTHQEKPDGEGET